MGRAKQVLGAESGPQAASWGPEEAACQCLPHLLLKVIFMGPRIHIRNHDKINNSCVCVYVYTHTSAKYQELL